MKPFLASPNETIEAVSEIEIKNGLCQKRHKLSKTKRDLAAPKKQLPVNVPDNPFTDARTT